MPPPAELPGSHTTRSGIGVISTGTAGYVTLDGSNYRLPAADFQKLESSFASSGSSSSTGLGQFGVDPQNWLKDPTVVEPLRARMQAAIGNL